MADGGMPPPRLTPTGLPVLDHILGGGLPIGLTLVYGNHKVIESARQEMCSVPERNLHSLPKVPTTLRELPHVVQGMALLYGKSAWPTIIDTGDLTGKFAGMGRDEAERDIEGTFGSLRDVGLRCNTSVLIELRMSDWERPYLMRVADTVLSVNSAGNWTVEKGKLPIQPPIQFNPLAKREAVTPKRVVAALLSDPALAWQVAATLRVLGPWLVLSNGFVREYPTGDRGAVIKTTRGSDRADLHVRIDGHDTSIIINLSDTETDVRAKADVALREHGFFLFDTVPS